MSFWRKQVVQPALDGDLRAALAEQYEILQHDPGNPQAHFALGTLHHLQGQTEAAIESFLQAIELDPAWRHAEEAARLGDRSLIEQLQRYPNVTH